MQKHYWRFKTIAEHKEAGTFEVGWNEEGMMDYLYGSFLPEKMEKYAESGETFQLLNTGSEISQKFHDTWSIIPEIHLTKVYSKDMEEDKSTKAVTPKTEGVPTFDIDRLAKEIDGIFQENLKTTAKKHTEVAEEITSQALKSLQGNTEEKIEKYKEEVEAIFPSMKDRLLEEFHKGRTILVLPDKSEIKVEHMDHPVLEAVMQSLHYQRKAMLVGPAG